MRWAVFLLLVCTSAWAGVEARKESKLTDGERMAIRESVNAEMQALHPVRTATRHEEPMYLTPRLSDRANLLFRALDSDGDKKLTARDVDGAHDRLSRHMPGLSPADFISFLNIADTNHDGSVDRDEFMEGLSASLKANSQTSEASASATLLETDAAEHRTGLLPSISGMLNNAKDVVSKGVASIKGEGGIDRSQDGCVLCQYIVERLEYSVKISGVIPGWSGAQGNPTIFLETDAQRRAITHQIRNRRRATRVAGVASFLEVAARQPFEVGAAGMIGAARAETRAQRQLERVKYNEIYRITDLTLDDVCESSMPTGFYGYCKNIYQSQHKVVDGLRYQYRPADVCVRIGMCDSKSYLFKGVHSRYKDLPD